jgi:hypothetical protein
VGYTDDSITINTAELPHGVSAVPGLIVSGTTWSSSPAHAPGIGNQRANPVGPGSPVSAASAGGIPDASTADRAACAAGS